MFHTGHGNNVVWEQSLHVNDLRRIKNADHLPVMMSIGCNTAQFCALAPYESYLDVNGVEHKGTYAGEVFKFRAAAARCVSKGAAQFGRFGQATRWRRSEWRRGVHRLQHGRATLRLALMDNFAKSWGNNPSARLGDCWMEAVSNYYEQEHLATIKPNADWYPPSIFFQAMKYMVYGDPSLRLPH